MAAHPLRIAVIPDAQVKPGVSIEHLDWCGRYLAAKQPDVIVNIGDFADMPSLSTHDGKGTKNHEGQRYQADVDATKRGMDALLLPIARTKGYRPEMHLTLGNHEDRIDRAVNEDPAQEGNMSIDDLRYADYGWEVHPYKQPVTIGGVAFCHYFPSGPKQLPIGSAKALLAKMHMSCVAGHLQGRDIAFSRRGDGQDMTAIIAGSFYTHNEKYMGPVGNKHWRGIVMLHEVNDGAFDEMFVSVAYLKRKFGR